MARRTVCKRIYILNDGTESRSAKPDVKELQMRFLGDDGETVEDTLTIDVSKLNADVAKCALFHGVNQKVGDTFAGAAKSGESPFEAASAMWEALVGGEWIKEGESAGPRTTYLLDAIMAVIVAAKGPDADTTETRAKVAETIKTADQKKAAMADPRIKAAFEQIKLEAQKERAKAAAAKAKEGGGEDFLAGLA